MHCRVTVNKKADCSSGCKWQASFHTSLPCKGLRASFFCSWVLLGKDYYFGWFFSLINWVSSWKSLSFGIERRGYQPQNITLAKGLHKIALSTFEKGIKKLNFETVINFLLSSSDLIQSYKVLHLSFLSYFYRYEILQLLHFSMNLSSTINHFFSPSSPQKLHPTEWRHEVHALDWLFGSETKAVRWHNRFLQLEKNVEARMEK